VQVVNGYVCNNCTEVDLAKRGIDPAHKNDGPYGVNSEKNRAERRERQAPLATEGTLGTQLHVFA
jgi:hypothetical protein